MAGRVRYFPSRYGNRLDVNEAMDLQIPELTTTLYFCLIWRGYSHSIKISIGEVRDIMKHDIHRYIEIYCNPVLFTLEFKKRDKELHLRGVWDLYS